MTAAGPRCPEGTVARTALRRIRIGGDSEPGRLEPSAIVKPCPDQCVQGNGAQDQGCPGAAEDLITCSDLVRGEHVLSPAAAAGGDVDAHRSAGSLDLADRRLGDPEGWKHRLIGDASLISPAADSSRLCAPPSTCLMRA